MEPKSERDDDDASFASSMADHNGKEDHTVIELDMQGLLEAGDHHQSQPYYNYVNSLSSWEMDSLTALCDTFLPSIDVSDVTTDEAILKFFSTSASMAATPERVGGMISQRLKHPKKWLLRVALWVLSTWIGTMVLCGREACRANFHTFKDFLCCGGRDEKR